MDLTTIAAIAVVTNKNKIKKSSSNKNFIGKFFTWLAIIIAVGLSMLLFFFVKF